MWRLTVLIVVSVYLSGLSEVTAQDITFYEDDVVQSGDQYINVYVLDTPPDPTTIDMYDGSVDNFMVYHSNTANILDGTVDVLFSYDSSSTDISGGTVNSFFPHDNSESIIAGGIVGTVGVYDSSVLNISSGEVTDWLSATGSSTVNVYGYDLEAVSVGGLWGYGIVTGYWFDDITFSIDLYDQETYSHVNLIPEPCTLSFLALGGLALRRRRSKP